MKLVVVAVVVVGSMKRVAIPQGDVTRMTTN